MNIIDQYIADHQGEMTNSQMAEKIGISEVFVSIRRKIISKPLPLILVSKEEELHALVQFILERKTGCLVDIAEQRIRDISRAINISV